MTIFEAGKDYGGAMGASMVDVPPSSDYPLRPTRGYVLPATRLLEKHYSCSLDLLKCFPCVSDTSKTIAQDIIDFNRDCPYDDKARILDSAGQVVDDPSMGASVADGVRAVELILLPDERLCEGKTIDEFGFSDQFFESQFFLSWSTMMGPLRKHSLIEFKRYFHRFLDVAPYADTMANVWRTRLNQDDGVARPILSWLRGKGVDAEGNMLAESVNFRANTVVKAVNFAPDGGGIRAESLEFATAAGSASPEGAEQTITLGEQDYVFVTLGSQVANLSVGSMDVCPTPVIAPKKAWALWTQIKESAAHCGRGDFGDPDVFFDPHTKEFKADPLLSTWVTFTATSNKPTFLDLLSRLTGNKPWQQGIVTLANSPWLLSVAPFPKPHFYGQPEDIWAWWGFSLCHDKPEEHDLPGKYITKSVRECSGSEILVETVRQFGFKNSDLADILGSSVCIPCLLPHAGSVWMRRRRENRPKVVPDGAKNFAFLGQFCEIPEDTMFTMEYSVRSAQMAIEQLFDGPGPKEAVYDGLKDPVAVAAALARFGLNWPIP